LLRRCGIEQETRILGFRKNVYEIMHASDLIVFPSRLKACGRACFEAGALRKPVIVTMPTKNTGVVLDEKTGLILPDARPDLLACGIERFINDPELCQKMGDAGYAHVRKNFDPDVYANRIMSLYDSVLGGAGDANSRPTCGGGTSYELASL
jgi:glycosyltransferase involved in cell wall biosynthesis